MPDGRGTGGILVLFLSLAKLWTHLGGALGATVAWGLLVCTLWDVLLLRRDGLSGGCCGCALAQLAAGGLARLGLSPLLFL